MRFRAQLEQHGRTATGLVVPDAVVEALGSRRPAVRATLHLPDGSTHTWRTSVASMGGRFLLGVSAAERAASGVGAGDLLDVELALDTEVRELEVPADLQQALDAEPAAAAAFARLSYSGRRRHVMAVDAAKTDATRARRVAGVVEALREA